MCLKLSDSPRFTGVGQCQKIISFTAPRFPFVRNMWAFGSVSCRHGTLLSNWNCVGFFGIGTFLFCPSDVMSERKKGGEKKERISVTLARDRKKKKRENDMKSYVVHKIVRVKRTINTAWVRLCVCKLWRRWRRQNKTMRQRIAIRKKKT